MKLTNPLQILAGLTALLLVSGCTYFRDGLPQEVSVYTFPSGADVVYQGETIGQTPLEVSLPRKIPHMLLLQKDGYKEHAQEVFPIRNEWGYATVQFGLAEDFGFYYDLVPSPVEVQLIPSIIPDSRGVDPFGEMAEKVMEVDAQRESGNLDPVEHKYIVEKIIEFYSE